MTAGMQEEKASTLGKLESAQEQLAASKDQLETHVREYQANSKTRDAIALQEKTRELSTLKDQLETKRSEIERKHREQLEGLSSRNNELDSENRALRELKYELDAKVKDFLRWLRGCTLSSQYEESSIAPR